MGALRYNFDLIFANLLFGANFSFYVSFCSKDTKTNLKFGPVSEKGMKRELQGICPGIMLISSL